MNAGLPPMTVAADPPSHTPRRATGGRIRLRTLVLVRWVAIAGQALALVLGAFVLNVGFSFGLAAALVAVSVLLNLWLSFASAGTVRLGDRAAAGFLAFDTIQLGALLHVTGGLTNPFAILLLAPVTISATVLSRRSTTILSILAVAIITLLAVAYRALAWPEGQLNMPPLYLLGLWSALVMAVVFMAVYAGSVAEEARRMSDALAATQMALAREQRLSALGALAANAAHELGTPLSTIAVTAREIARDAPADGPLAEDAQLLLAETKRCRDILARLAARPETVESTPFSRLPVPAVVELAGAAHRLDRIAFHYASEGDEPQPQIAPVPEIVQGLGNLIQNAAQFARTRVDIRTRWNTREVAVTVADDGPGFAPEILAELGEPYRSTRAGEGEHMGLGVFIAVTLLERTGAAIVFGNQAEGGATITVRWPRGRLERGAAMGTEGT